MVEAVRLGHIKNVHSTHFSVVVGLALVATSTMASACDCADRYLNVMNGKKNAAAVFTGMVTAKTGRFGDMLYTMRVDSVWKGTLLRNAYVYGGKDACAFAFRVGTMYLVYTEAGRGTATDPAMTTVCASNKEISGATTEIKSLGKPVENYEQAERLAKQPHKPVPAAPANAKNAPSAAATAEAASAAAIASARAAGRGVAAVAPATIGAINPLAPVPAPISPAAANAAMKGPPPGVPVRVPPPVQSTPGPMVAPAPPPTQ